jgi:pimeloyl-ACP methyl ester carboxylesterase
MTVFRRLGGPPAGEVWTLLHGWPTTSWDWAVIAPTIERTHRTLQFDWPGLGASSKGDDIDYSIDALTETVIELWRHDGIAATRIVAHDVGTIVAQELLARDLEGRLDVDLVSVTWLNGSLYPDLCRPTPSQLALLDVVSGPAVAATIDADLYCADLAAAHDPAHRPSPATLAQHWIAFGGAASTREMPRFLRHIPERRERADRLVGAIETTGVAQRFIWGDSDPISGLAQSTRIQQRFGPRVDLVSFADCSHYPHTERPYDVAQEMLRPW